MYVVYEVEASGLEADNGSSRVWCESYAEAGKILMASLNGDLNDEMDDEWEGSIVQRPVTWDQIVMALGDNTPDRSAFKVARAAEGAKGGAA